ncbi:MAG TPA: hypothetical protein VGE59_01620 [Patescibacteria group bacterium]
MTHHSTDSPNENPTAKTKRSHTWLQQQLDIIWSQHFSDIERLNIVTIEWGRTNRNRLGSITGKGGSRDNPTRSEIRINSLMRDERVPESVIWQTIAHELSHYCHGFCSPHPQKYPHAHRGNIIEKELRSRNLAIVYEESEAWLKANWRNYLAQTIGTTRRKAPIRRTYAPRITVSLLQNFKQGLIGQHRLRRRKRDSV